MLPAADLAEILANLSALNLQPNTTTAVIGAILAPLLRSSYPGAPVSIPAIRSGKKPGRPRGPRRKRKRSVRVAAAAESTATPRQRALAALKTNPGVSLTRVAEIAGVSRSTVVNARDELGAEAHKQARKQAAKSALKPETTERRARAQRFLQDALAHGPKPVSDIEAAAEKAHIELHTLQQARGALGVIVSRANTGGRTPCSGACRASPLRTLPFGYGCGATSISTSSAPCCAG
jgi:hypothetical protein